MGNRATGEGVAITLHALHSVVREIAALLEDLLLARAVLTRVGGTRASGEAVGASGGAM